MKSIREVISNLVYPDRVFNKNLDEYLAQFENITIYFNTELSKQAPDNYWDVYFQSDLFLRYYDFDEYYFLRVSKDRINKENEEKFLILNEKDYALLLLKSNQLGE